MIKMIIIIKLQKIMYANSTVVKLLKMNCILIYKVVKKLRETCSTFEKKDEVVFCHINKDHAGKVSPAVLTLAVCVV